MTKKGFLTKILPTILIFVLVLTIVLVISSCTKTKKAPYGSLGNAEYAGMTLSSGKKVSISETEVYNRLRYQGTDALNEEIEKIVFKAEIATIKADFETKGTSSEYYDELTEYIKIDAYGFSDDDEINELKPEEKFYKEKTFVQNCYLNGYDVDTTLGIFQDGIVAEYYLQVAKQQYAKDILLSEIGDIDSDNYISIDNITSSYDNTKMNKGDVSAIVVKFSTTAEANAVLKDLKLKFIKDSLYRVFPEEGHESDDYDKIYDDFSATKGVVALNTAEVLFEYVRLYNYMYSYRNQIVVKDMNGTSINFNTFMDDANKDYREQVYSYIYNIGEEGYTSGTGTYTYEDFKNEITDQTNTKVNYTYKDLESDTTIRNYLYNTIFDNKEGATPYSYSATAGVKGYFLAFKIKDSLSISFEAIDTLAKYADACADSTASADAIYTLYIDLQEIFYDQIKKFKNPTTGLYDDDAVKAYLLAQAVEMDVENISDEAWDKTNEDSIWSTVFNDMFTDAYIAAKANERIEDAKIVIYDPIIEILYAGSHDNYKKTSKSSPKGMVVASVTFEDEKTDIKVDDFNALLIKRYGASVVQTFFVNEALKDKYYSQITDEEFETFEENYTNTMNNFAAGSYETYGLSASIGKKAFMEIYFGSTNKEEAIYNMWVGSRLEEIYVTENIQDTYDDAYSKLANLTGYEYDNFLSLTCQTLTIYTDDDEDGNADSFDELTAERVTEIKEASVDLLNAIKTEFQNFGSSARATALSTIVSEYTDATRVSKIDGITSDYRFSSAAEKASYLWGKYKQLGLFLSVDSETDITSTESLDSTLAAQITEYYDYAKSLIKEDKLTPDFVVRTILSDIDLENKNIATEDKLIVTEDGIKALYITEGALAVSAKFTPADNPDDEEHTKLYPYDTNEDNPYPDTVNVETSLYNDNDILTANQILVYIREKADGVTSLTADVQNAIASFFEANVYTNFVSDAFGYILRDRLLIGYTIECNSEIEEKMDTIIKIKKDSLFTYTNEDFANEWWSTFGYTRYNGTVIEN